MTEFINAKPIWIKNKRITVNYQAGFRCDFNAELSKKYILKLTGATYYKIYLNGEFLAYGPARGAMGYVRCDELSLDVNEGINKLAIEVAGYNCASYYSIPMKSFLTAEIFEDGNSLKYTGRDFKGIGLDGLRNVKAHRFSSQRTFGEVWNFDNSSSLTSWKTSDELCYMDVYSFGISEKYIGREVKYPLYNIAESEKLEETGIIKHKDLTGDKEEFERKTEYAGHLVKISSECDGYLWEELTQNPIVELYGDFIPEDIGFEKNNILSDSSYAVYKMPCNNTGFLRNEIKALEDTAVYIFFGEYNSGNGLIFRSFGGPMNLITYNLKKSEIPYKLESFEPYTCQYIGIGVMKGKIEIKAPEIREYSYPEYKKAKFQSEDEALNLIFDAAANTFRQNTLDVYMDCPGRERGGWLCDTYFISYCERFFAGESRVEKVFLENYIMAEEFPNMPQGMIPMVYPGVSKKGTFIPQWSMWYVIELYEYAKTRADVDTDKYRDLVYGLFGWFSRYENEEGLLEKMPGWNFIEWSKANQWVQDVNYPTNMLYSVMNRCAGELFSDDALIEKAKKIRDTVISKSYDGEFFRDHSLRNEKGELVLAKDISETCQYYAYFTGFADEKFEKLTDVILNVCGPDNKDEKFKEKVAPANAFIGNYLRLIILLRMKKFDKAVSDVRGYFTEMAKITGTLWEHDDISRGSLNHGFASFAGIVICFGLSGIGDINYKEKKITMDKDYVSGINYSFSLETENGMFKVSEKDGVKKIELPEEWIIEEY